MIAIDLSPLVLDPRRGVSRALRYLLRGLVAAGRERPPVVGFVPARTRDDAGDELLQHGLDVRLLGVPPRPRLQRYRALRAKVQASGASVLLSPWAAFPRVRVPVVAWIHEVPFARHGALEGGLRTLRHRRALARAADLAAALVVPSEAVRSDLLHLHPEVDRRTQVVPHGFDPAPWLPRVVESRAVVVGASLPPALEPWRPRGPYALLVGTGRGAGGPRKKGVDVFAQAFAAGGVAGLEAVVVGSAPGLPGHVHVLPEVEDLHLRLLVRDARVVVVPSRSEGFGFPVLEAFAAGVPVVASAAGALPEVSGGAARLVPPGDAEALREAIAHVATDEDLRARMIQDGRRRAQEFPVAAMARGWLRVLTKAGGIPWRG